MSERNEIVEMPAGKDAPEKYELLVLFLFIYWFFFGG